MFVSSRSDAAFQTAVFGVHIYVWKVQPCLFIYQVERLEIKINLNPCCSAWNTKVFYAFVFEDLGFKLAEVLLCDRIPKDAAFSLMQLSEYIKAARRTSITTALLAHLSKTGRAGRSSGESLPWNYAKYWTQGAKKKKLGSSSAGSANMTRFMVCSFSECFTGRNRQVEEQKAKKQEKQVNFRRTRWKQSHQFKVVFPLSCQ